MTVDMSSGSFVLAGNTSKSCVRSVALKNHRDGILIGEYFPTNMSRSPSYPSSTMVHSSLDLDSSVPHSDHSNTLSAKVFQISKL